MRRRRIRRLAALLLASVLVPAGSVLAEPARASGLVLWWNDPDVVRVLSLDEKTRAAMDGAHRKYAEDGSARQIRQSRAAFKRALIDGNWETARKELDAIARPTLQEGTLKIEVLRLLSTEQRELLVRRFPTVFRRKWKPTTDWKDALAPGAAQESPPPDSESEPEGD